MFAHSPESTVAESIAMFSPLRPIPFWTEALTLVRFWTVNDIHELFAGKLLTGTVEKLYSDDETISVVITGLAL